MEEYKQIIDADMLSKVSKIGFKFDWQGELLNHRLVVGLYEERKLK
ncbi:hypothetical protein [Periweissella cryptocerci]|nr:hypothetical protein [Periweissella cryptocerci]